MHPSITQVLKQFDKAHLSGNFPDVVARYHLLAHTVAGETPNTVETTIALRLLLQSMDAACRAK